MARYKITLSVCSGNEYKVLFTAPASTLAQANERYERILKGEENYGQYDYPATLYGVFLSIKNTKTGKAERIMQIN